MSSHTFSLFPAPESQKRLVSHSRNVSLEKSRPSIEINTALTRPPVTALVATTTTRSKAPDGEGEITVHATTVIRVDSPIKTSNKADYERKRSQRKSLRRVAKIVYPMVPKRSSNTATHHASQPALNEKQRLQLHESESERPAHTLHPQSSVVTLPTYQQQDWATNQIPSPPLYSWNQLSASYPPVQPASPPRVRDPRLDNHASTPSGSTPQSATTGTPSTYHASPSTAPTSAHTSPRISLHNKFTPPVPQGPFRALSPPVSPPEPGRLHASPPPHRHRSPSPGLSIRTETTRIPSPPPMTPPPQPIASIFPVYDPSKPLVKQNYYPAYNPVNLSTSPPRHQISRDYSSMAGTASPPLLVSPPATKTTFDHAETDASTIGLAVSPATEQDAGGLGGFVHYAGAGGSTTAMCKGSLREGHGPVFPAPPLKDFDGAKGERKRRLKYEEGRAREREEARLASLRAMVGGEESVVEQGTAEKPRRQKSGIARFFAKVLRGRW